MGIHGPVFGRRSSRERAERGRGGVTYVVHTRISSVLNAGAGILDVNYPTTATTIRMPYFVAFSCFTVHKMTTMPR